ncbi:MAG: sensor histidine kinase [Gammaproteobacteria bacterium]|nr:sensor histidine kinase [Gammaproteobacteria bacterium]
MYSLKKKITRSLVINMLVVMSGLLVTMYFSMQQLLQDYVLTRLEHDTESLVTVIYQDQKQQWHVDPTKMSTIYNRVKSSHYYRLTVGDQTLTSRSVFDTEFPISEKDLASPGHYLADGPGQEVWLVRYQQVNKNNQLINIWVAENIMPLRQQLLHYSAYAIILILIATTMLIYLQRRTLERSFHIFEVLRQNIASVRHKEMDKIGVQVPREIIPLVNEIEILVEQLRNRINRSRHAISNLAHELKRPLQLLSQQQESSADEEQLKPLHDIRAILERELKRAKISGSQGLGGSFNIDQELPFMIEVLAKIYPPIDIHFENSENISSLDLDRDDMLELIGNLLDNACKFASQRVNFQITGTEQGVKLIVDDDGKGIEKDEMEKIKKRGVRLDETREGHGLGLGICWDIVNSYHGNLLFFASPMGGLQVCVEIPLQT